MDPSKYLQAPTFFVDFEAPAITVLQLATSVRCLGPELQGVLSLGQRNFCFARFTTCSASSKKDTSFNTRKGHTKSLHLYPLSSKQMFQLPLSLYIVSANISCAFHLKVCKEQAHWRTVLYTSDERSTRGVYSQ